MYSSKASFVYLSVKERKKAAQIIPVFCTFRSLSHLLQAKTLTFLERKETIFVMAINKNNYFCCRQKKKGGRLVFMFLSKQRHGYSLYFMTVLLSCFQSIPHVLQTRML